MPWSEAMQTETLCFTSSMKHTSLHGIRVGQEIFDMRLGSIYRLERPALIYKSLFNWVVTCKLLILKIRNNKQTYLHVTLVNVLLKW